MSDADTSTTTDAPAGPQGPAIDDEEDSTPEPVASNTPLQPPETHSSWVPFSAYLSYRRWRKKRRKYAKQGYVQWKLLGATDPAPKFVKPELKAGGIPEYEHNGQTYLFPPEAALPDARTGMWTFYHRQNDAKPINPATGAHPSIDPADLKEYLTKRPTASPPGWFDKFDLDPQSVMMYLVVGIIVFAVLQRALGGGF